MSFRVLPLILRSLVLVLLAPGPCIATASTCSDVPPSLRAAIEKERYRIEPASGGVSARYRASNPAQGLTVSFGPSGVEVSSEAASATPWQLEMKLKGWGYGTKTRAATAPQLMVSGDRIEYRRALLTEWYVNGRAGVEQGFILQRPPASQRGGELALRMVLSGNLVSSLAGEGQGLRFEGTRGEPILRFGGLKAFDAAGRFLPTRMELRGRELALLVDDSTAIYPVTVDPLLTNETKLTASDAANDKEFGSSVAISGDTAVVGAFGDDHAGFRSGAAYVFVRRGGTWSQQQKLTASDAAAFDQFGFSVSVSEDTAVIGSLGDSGAGSGSGSAYVFVRSGGIWSQQAKLTASDSAAGDAFGFSVAISGDTVVVGAYGDSDAGLFSGAAYIFVRSGSVWSQQQKLTASDAAAGDAFGDSVAISGDTVVVGSPFDSDAGDRSGSAYVFIRDGGVWSQQQKLTASDAAHNDEFGYSVALSGDTAVVGAPFDSDPGFFNLIGSAYVFMREGAVWTQQKKLIANEASAPRQFGWSVAVSGETAVVGAPFDSNASFFTFTGSAYVFLRRGRTWSQQQKLTASDATLFAHFGWSVAASGGAAVVGSPFGQLGANPGSVYVYTSQH